MSSISQDSTQVSPDATDPKAPGDFDATHVFEDVVQNFRDSLSCQEKTLFKEFHNPRDMLHDLQTKCKEVRNGRKLSKLCHIIERFASAWEPFFEVTSIFVQTHPEFAGIAWGAIRLVFLLGTNYTVHLEKLVTMIQRIGEMLPSYEEYFNIFARRKKTLEDAGSTLTLELRHHRLQKALSFVYADIVQFCQDACRLFGSKRGGTRYTPSLIADVFWKPFDSRFASLLDRMRAHQEVFKTEMQLEESKYLEFMSEKQARQSSLMGKALEQIQAQTAELRQSNIDLDLKLSSQLDRLIQEKHSNHHRSKGQDSEEKEALFAKVAQVKAWVAAPDYMREYEKSRRIRLPETGAYILGNSIYKQWRNKTHNCDMLESDITVPVLPNLLMVKGKPGFGKTILSSLVIEDLECYGPVFFYHFSSEKRDSCDPYHALRAVLVQLVHHFRTMKNIIDQVAVLMDADDSGQAIASDEEVLASLSLILATAPRTSMVFDGIDECDDYEYFLELIHSISTATSHKVLLLGRPNVEAASMHHLSLYLDQAWNLPDIKLYLCPKVAFLQERHLIPDTLDIEEVVGALAHRAEGMFLWAWLMIQYLNCRALSPKERLDAILTPSIVEGLGDVYEKILRVLDRGYQKEKGQILKIFEILTAALRPISVSELELAIAITPGSVTEASSIIVDFERALPVICCGLVEVVSDKRVRFAHSSFRDFITSRNERQTDSPFSVNECRAHLTLSTISLSYIIYDLPSSSVCHVISSSAANHVRKRFPFIAYSLCWPQHAIQGLRAKASNSAPKLENDAQDNLFAFLTKFLSHPLSVTAWIETSWLLQSEPSLAALADACSEIILPGFQSSMETGSIALTMLREASSDLRDLNAQWNHLLRIDPLAIWGSSITAFSTSSYWYQTEDTIISSMLPAEATGAYRKGSAHWSILVQSQLSSSGEDFGVVIMIPSRSYLLAMDALSFEAKRMSRVRGSPFLSVSDRDRIAHMCCTGWKVRLQRRRVHDQKILMDIDAELPEQQIFNMLQQSLASQTPHRFSIPVCFSCDLNRLVMLDSILSIRYVLPEDPGAPVAQWRLQSLGQGFFIRTQREDLVFSITFAPNASAFAFVSADRNPGAINYKKIQVWSNAAADDEWPRFECKGEVLASGMRSPKYTPKELFAFHPWLPLIAYCEWRSVIIWNYNEEQIKHRTLLEKTPASIYFAEDGKHVQYVLLDYDIEEQRASFNPSSPPSRLVSRNGGIFSAGGVGVTPRTEQLGLDLLFDFGHTSSSALARQKTTPMTICSNGAVVNSSSVLVHLPRLQGEDQTTVSRLPLEDRNEGVLMMWNKSAQSSYSIYDHQPQHLPSIIYRRQRSISDVDGCSHEPKRRRLQ